jgi:hypothetical protein
VLGGLAGVAVVAVGGYALVDVVRDDGEATTTPPVDLGDDEQAAVARIGERYAEVDPADAEPAAAEAALRANGVTVDDEGRATGLATAAARDHREGDVVVLDGWVLSRSELRYAAVVAARGAA